MRDDNRACGRLTGQGVFRSVVSSVSHFDFRPINPKVIALESNHRRVLQVSIGQRRCVDGGQGRRQIAALGVPEAVASLGGQVQQAGVTGRILRANLDVPKEADSDSRR